MTFSSLPQQNILGTRLNVVTLLEATNLLEIWASQRKSGYICPATVYSVMSAYRSETYKKILNSSLMNIPDGMPLVWVLRIFGYKPTRVHGPDLMLAVCCRSPKNDIRHFLLGGAEGQAEEVRNELSRMYPGIEIVGAISSPRENWSESDDLAVVSQIQSSGANLVWIGMGTPWQDEWVSRFSAEIQGPVVGIGSAFDFISGRVPWAPDWIQRTGLQWLYRLAREPRRLWRRYLINNPLFVWLVTLQLIGIRKYPMK